VKILKRQEFGFDERSSRDREPWRESEKSGERKLEEKLKPPHAKPAYGVRGNRVYSVEGADAVM